jgi:hypothetical protein
MKKYIKLFEEFKIPEIAHKIEWKEADKIIHPFLPFHIIDVGSGNSWMMMRTSGKYHADVEPITKEDTEKMLSCFPKSDSFEKSIYRPVIVEIGSERYAAALMGFPHAGSNSTPFKQKTKHLSGGFKNMRNWDYNRDNGVVGHFCLHFLGSIRHTDKKTDLDAQKAIMSL